ncbi:WD40-repeat-containing domain protein [Macrophomina phaseolina]|uniref:WD40-repeat-containing domain protein n=1 Tax=Macrophomina phaseolina TaxID=35725 RepID=A0ABQ8GU00_9PEZI|nr:WD40-repeat-containing domain protein [Macrophomina phaseolina]
MTSVKSISSLWLDIPPSCIEFVPGHPELFVVGTYFLEKTGQDEEESGTTSETSPQHRTGSLLLFKLDGDRVTLKHELSTPFAIFDIHFSQNTNSSPTCLLGAATSTGSLSLYRVSTDDITLLTVHQLFPTTSLITFFSWHPLVPGLASLALSDGSIYLCDTSIITLSPTPPPPTEPGDSSPHLALLHTHALEAWCTAFTPTGTAIFTGGDDSVLASISLPLPNNTDSTTVTASSSLLATVTSNPPPLQWQDRKTHFAGVTAILPLKNSNTKGNNAAHAPELLLTGSYDDHIRLFAVPQPATPSSPRRPQLLAELNLGGGVWRLKDISTISGDYSPCVSGKREYTLLASCMHAGARIVKLTGSPREGEGSQGELEWGFTEVARFEEHESMNYGSDVQPGTGGRKVISTSFYDRLLAVWRW